MSPYSSLIIVIAQMNLGLKRIMTGFRYLTVDYREYILSFP